MADIIDMPKLSDTMTVGTLVAWLKNEGDTIEPGDMIAEVETDKATMELENFESGVLLKKFVKEGEAVPVGAPIAAVGEAGESVPEPDASNKSASKKEKQASSQEALLSATEVPEISSVATTQSPSNNRIFASPLARKMAAERNIPLESLQGSGPHGRIVKNDVLSAKSKGATSQPAAVAATLASEDIPVSNMRRAIAQHLVTSKTTTPHFYLDIEIDVAPLLNLRASLNEKLGALTPEQGGVKLTVNDFILKATAEAIRQVPNINTSWQDSIIKKYASVHLAFGVAVDNGLVTPVIRDAQSKSLRQISIEAKNLIQKARDKKLTPAEMSNSTFTVTNLGMYGINNFFGIINPPNAGILSVGATLTKPVVDAQGNIVPGQRMNVGFSGDHRVIDGAVGAEFLKALKSVIETPSLMLI